MKINKERRNNSEVSIIYGDDDSININVFNNKYLFHQDNIYYSLYPIFYFRNKY